MVKGAYVGNQILVIRQASRVTQPGRLRAFPRHLIWLNHWFPWYKENQVKGIIELEIYLLHSLKIVYYVAIRKKYIVSKIIYSD